MFHLIFTEPGKVFLVQPCSPSPPPSGMVVYVLRPDRIVVCFCREGRSKEGLVCYALLCYAMLCSVGRCVHVLIPTPPSLPPSAYSEGSRQYWCAWYNTPFRHGALFPVKIPFIGPQCVFVENQLES